MNTLLAVGLMLSTGFTAGWLATRLSLPRIVGYIVAGILLGPNTFGVVEAALPQSMQPLMQMCLAFIAFEVGGSLHWKKLKDHEKDILAVTLLASLAPLVLIVSGILLVAWLTPGIIPLAGMSSVLLTAIALGSLASPTDPTATFAVMHQYKAHGPVTDTILGVAALDDVLGILLFSLTIAAASMVGPSEASLGQALASAAWEIGAAAGIGLVLGASMTHIRRKLAGSGMGEGQWIIIVFALIALCAGASQILEIDAVLAAMTMGATVANLFDDSEEIFGLLERYNEDLIFLFFFVLSGMYLDPDALRKASGIIVLFVGLRTIGKIFGTWVGATLAHSEKPVRQFTGGGLLPQGGVVIGLALTLKDSPIFHNVAPIVLATIMGATLIHEFCGPLAARRALRLAGELQPPETRAG